MKKITKKQQELITKSCVDYNDALNKIKVFEDGDEMKKYMSLKADLKNRYESAQALLDNRFRNGALFEGDNYVDAIQLFTDADVYLDLPF